MCSPCTEQPETAMLRLDSDTQVMVHGCALHLALVHELVLTGRRIQRTVSGFPKRPEFRCPRCGKSSANPWDAIFGFCGNCHAYTA